MKTIEILEPKSLREYLNIGTCLRVIRESYGERQNVFAKRLDISRSTYTSYENNKRIPEDELLQKMVSNLGITLTEFFKQKEPKITYVKSVDEFSTDELLKELLRRESKK